MPFSEFVKKARMVHGGKYKYDKASYSRSGAKLAITCPEHGEFTQQGGSHLAGKGCPVCAQKRKSAALRAPFAEFLRRARKVHKDKYEYDESSYAGIDNKLIIICPEHGKFSQLADHHLHKHGCPACAWERLAAENRFSFAEFKRRAKKVHGKIYKYDESSFTGAHKKVAIICPKHGEFKQTASDHLSGHGCPLCGFERMASAHRVTFAEYVRRANKAHRNKYKYDEASFCGMHKKVTIICRKHGEFTQGAEYHLAGQGCPKCRNSESG
jgi:Zn finger protein HypA/HybF involved in hydrogenase expression